MLFVLYERYTDTRMTQDRCIVVHLVPYHKRFGTMDWGPSPLKTSQGSGTIWYCTEGTESIRFRTAGRTAYLVELSDKSLSKQGYGIIQDMWYDCEYEAATYPTWAKIRWGCEWSAAFSTKLQTLYSNRWKVESHKFKSIDIHKFNPHNWTKDAQIRIWRISKS